MIILPAIPVLSSTTRFHFEIDMTPADKARDNAIHCEMVKYAYRQTKDGVVVSFVVHPNDVPPALSISHIGARYMVALVEIGDDEQPVVEHRREAMPNPQTSNTRQLDAQPQPDKPAGAKRDWKDLQPQQQAGIRCGEPTFTAFLKEQYGRDWREAEDAAACIRLICEVNSRVELGTDQRARLIWNQLDSHYQAWLIKERVGA